MVRYDIRHSLTATLQVLRWCADKGDTYMIIGPRVVVGVYSLVRLLQVQILE